MTLGTLNHLAVTISNRAKSEPFYNAILQFMGYQQVEKKNNFIMWWSQNTGAILLYDANPNCANKIHDRYSPGLHHLAWNADSREQVDNLYQMLLEIGATVLDPPAQYDHYAPGYYAVFFADPDGMKLELVHMPNIPEEN